MENFNQIGASLNSKLDLLNNIYARSSKTLVRVSRLECNRVYRIIGIERHVNSSSTYPKVLIELEDFKVYIPKCYEDEILKDDTFTILTSSINSIGLIFKGSTYLMDILNFVNLNEV